MNLQEHKRDLIAISSLLTIVIVITLLLLNIDGKVGVYYVRDVFFYLNNALFYAGYDVGLANTRGLSPLIPMITSIFFRMGFISDFTIIAVSSTFYIFAALGMYFLLRLRLDEVLSFTGSMIFSTFPLVIVWVTKGMLDIPGLCIAIWAVYFMMLAFRRNTKYFYVAFPLIILGFFTRYTVLLMVPVLLIQFFLTENPISFIKTNIKDIVIGIGAGALVFAAFIGTYIYLNIGIFFLTQGSDVASSSHNALYDMSNNVFYYFNNFLIYIGAKNFIPYSLKPGAYLIDKMQWVGGRPSKISYTFAAISIIGIVLYLTKLFNAENREIIRNNCNKVRLAIFIVGLAVFFLTFMKVSIVLSVIIISIALVALYRILSKTDMDDLTFDFIMFYWFVVNLSFITYYHINVDRYFMPVLPTVAFFIVLSMKMIFDKLKSVKYMDKVRVIVPIGLVCLILICSGVYAMSNSPHSFDNNMYPNFETAALEEKTVGGWLMEHDPQYMNKTIWADRGGDMSFILRTEIPSYEKESNATNFTEKMINENVTYFIAKDNKTIAEPYNLIYENGEVHLYYYKNDK